MTESLDDFCYAGTQTLRREAQTGLGQKSGERKMCDDAAHPVHHDALMANSNRNLITTFA